jgi:ABC-type uncharacterized transport system permease subunit
MWTPRLLGVCRGKLEGMILPSGNSSWLWLFAAAGLAAYLVPVVVSATKTKVIVASLTTAWALHACLLALALFSGRFGFGPALSVTAWLVLTVYGVESVLYPRIQSRQALAGLGGLALMIGLVFPGVMMDTKHSVWFPLHGAFGVAAYGLMAVSTVHAWLIHRADAQMRAVGGQTATDSGLPLMTLERLMIGFVVAAFVLLSGTLAAGWLFGEELYGRANAWQWNHKTIFSILAWGAMAVLLLGRWQRGWRGKHAARFVYGSAILLLLSYVGSRFVLEVLLQRAT